MRSLRVMSASEKDTEILAGRLAGLLKPPMVLALKGDLGAGKTTFVRGFVRALSGGEPIRVQSPTYALAKTYQTTPPVHHIDLYRMDRSAPLEDLGVEELIYDPHAFICIEWPDHHFAKLPSEKILVQFPSTSATKREITFFPPENLDIQALNAK